MRLNPFFFVVFFLTSTFLSAQDAVQIQSLVKALSSPSATKRMTAEKTLLEFGPQILPFLPETIRTPEAKMRLNRIRVELERQSVQDSLEAGKVTIPQDLKVTEISGLILEQTQNLLEFQLPPNSTFQFSSIGTPTPFWEFLDALCDQFQLEPQVMEQKKGLKLIPKQRKVLREASSNPCVVYLQPFRLEVINTKTTAAPAAMLQLELAWEPRIQPVFAYLKFQSVSFDGGKYGSFPANEYEILINQKEFRSLCDVPLSARIIPEKARSMNLLGTLSVVACGMKKDFIFRKLEQKLNREFPPESEHTAAVLVTFSRLRTEQVGKQKFLVAALRYRYEESHEAMESHRTWIYENEAFLRTLDGREIPSERSEMLRQTPNEIMVEVYFPVTNEILKNLSEWELIFPRPSGIYELELPFELKEIQLPSGETD